MVVAVAEASRGGPRGPKRGQIAAAVKNAGGEGPSQGANGAASENRESISAERTPLLYKHPCWENKKPRARGAGGAGVNWDSGGNREQGESIVRPSRPMDGAIDRIHFRRNGGP